MTNHATRLMKKQKTYAQKYKNVELAHIAVEREK